MVQKLRETPASPKEEQELTATGVLNKLQRGFTLFELLIAIALLGILAAFISGNFLNSLKKGRDAKRKADLIHIQSALESYYEDTKAYPATLTFGDKLCHSAGCSTKTYMQKIPSDPNTDNTYVYQTDENTYYKLYSCIENVNDQGSGVQQSGYAGVNCEACGSCKFGVSSSNVSP